MVPRRTGNDRLMRDKETGKTVSIPYDILTHDEWALAHPGSCFNPKSEPNPIRIGTGKKRFLTSEIERQRNRERKAQSRIIPDGPEITDSKDDLRKTSPQDGDRLQSPTWTESSPQPGGKSCPQDGDVSSKVSSKSGSKRFVGEKSDRPKTETPLSFPSDLTVTIGSQINLFASLEELLSQISDGELETEKIINTYEYREELQTACIEAVELQANAPFNRKSLGDVMGKVMDLLKEQHDLKAPKAWLVVMRELRKGGTCKTAVNTEPTPEPMDPRAAWEAGRRALGF